jgi:hypothetical protein
MNDNENFESLRRLLALKRHETPPPGYFNNFSNQVVAQIRAGKSKASASWLELPWLSKFLETLQTKPAFAGGFAAALCLLLIAGIIYAGQTESAPQQLLSSEANAITPMASVTPQASLPQTANQPMLASSDNSTNPVFGLPPVASLFDQIQPSVTQPVSYSPSGN